MPGLPGRTAAPYSARGPGSCASGCGCLPVRGNSSVCRGKVREGAAESFSENAGPPAIRTEVRGLGGKSKGQFHGRVLGMDRARSSADRQGWFAPGAAAHPFGQVFGSHQAKQTNQRALVFTEHHGPLADDDQSHGSRGIIDSLFLRLRRHGEDTGEESPSGEMPRGGRTIIRNVSTQFKPAGNLLRVIPWHSAAGRKIGRTAKDQIELLVRAQHVRFAEIAFADLEARLHAVPSR